MSDLHSANVTFRPMEEAEVHQLVDWATAEGWDPGKHDADCFWQADPHGFLAMEIDGVLAGGGDIVRHNPKFGFMGLFIVKPEFRGKGFGRQLWFKRRDTLRARLDADGTIGLDAVTNMIPFYAAGGFQPDTRHLRYQSGENSSVAPANVKAAAGELVPITQVDFADVHDMDERCFPGTREAFLQPWLNQPGAHSLAFVNNSQLQGYGVMRPCQVGWKLGPLHCNSPEVAAAMLPHFVSLAGEGPVFIDAPENNPAATALCEQLGMNVVFECTRMYFGPTPRMDDAAIYGNTTLELG